MPSVIVHYCHFCQIVYVMPSSSARCSQLPRASDKVPFFVALRKLRDHICGRLPRPLDESEVVFPDLDLKVEPRRDRRPPPVTTSGPPVEPIDRKRHYPDDEDRLSGGASTQGCDAASTSAVSSPLWQHSLPTAGLPNWSSYASFNPQECAYGSRKFRDGPPPYSSCMPNAAVCMPFGWGSDTSSRWSAAMAVNYPSSHLSRRPPSLDRSFLPDVGSGLMSRPGYGALPPYPYASPSSAGLRAGPSLLPDCGPMMNSNCSPAVLDMLTPCNPLLRSYPQ